MVNVVGSFIIAILARHAHTIGPRGLLLADTGFVATFTTFSSLSYETLRLVEDGSYREGLLNPVLNVVCSLLAVSVGWLAGAAW